MKVVVRARALTPTGKIEARRFRETLIAALGGRKQLAKYGVPIVSDSVNQPSHYTAHPGGIECIDLVEQLGFCQGNAIKYLWRAGLKGDALEDLRKARWYVDRFVNSGTARYIEEDVQPGGLLEAVAKGFLDGRVAAAITFIAEGYAEHQSLALKLIDELIAERERADD